MSMVLILVDHAHMIFCVSFQQHLKKIDLLEVKDSPVIFLLVDESTDRSL
jgi:hypothetical protein